MLLERQTLVMLRGQTSALHGGRTSLLAGGRTSVLPLSRTSVYGSEVGPRNGSEVDLHTDCKSALERIAGRTSMAPEVGPSTMRRFRNGTEVGPPIISSRVSALRIHASLGPGPHTAQCRASYGL